MKDDRQPGDSDVTLEPELEARLVAWASGDAGPGEAAELEHLAAARPELARVKARLVRVHELVGEAARPDPEPLRLAPERRAQLLQALRSVPASEQPAKKIPFLSGRRAWQRTQILVGLAATLAIASLVLLNFDGSREQAKILELTAGAGFGGGMPRDDAPRVVGPELTSLRKAKSREAMVATGVVDERMTAGFDALGSPQYAPLGPSTNLDPAVKMDAFEVKEDREGFGAAAVTAARSGAPADVSALLPRPMVQFGLSAALGPSAPQTGLETAVPKSIELSLPTAPPPAAGSGSLLAATTGGGLSLGAPAESTTPSGGAVTGPAEFRNARPGGQLAQSPMRPAVGGSRAFAGTGSVALGTPMPAPAASPDVITLDAFSVSAPDPADKAARRRAGSSQPPAAMNGETLAAQEPVSTFSLHVSDVSFRLVQAALAAMERGENPTEPKVRAEEIYNAFDYGDPFPGEREKIAARLEQAAHPFLPGRNLVRIALRVGSTGRGAGQPLRLTVLLDTSGSMEREDRRAAVRRAIEALAGLLGPDDRVTLIGFARQPRLLVEHLPGNQAAELVRLVTDTPPDGGTNLEAALLLAGELALRHRLPEAQNRIVLLTDGAANLGDADPAGLMARVEKLRAQGVAFDACGVGLEGIGDTVLEALTRRGDGRYYVLDRPEVADAEFARKLAGAFRPAAENVKVQVRFNPARVASYRLIGFEERRLNAEDFRNDAVDAAELAANEAAVAMYQVEPRPEGAGDLGEVSARFRDPATGEMVERSWPIAYDPRAPVLVRASHSMRLAGAATLLAETMTSSSAGEQVKLAELAPLVNQLRGLYPDQPRVAELETMFQQLRRLRRE